MNKINFEQFKSDARSYGGSDSKKNIYMNGKYYMVKLPNFKENEKDNSLKTSVSNSTVSEYIGSHIMQIMGLPAQNTILGFWEGELAVACEDFRKEGFELHEFSWYMQDVYAKSEIGRIPTYEQLYGTMRDCSFLSGDYQRNIERYWDIIVRDALLGNFDRHKDNFGFLTNGHEISPAPVYDCGSCLYPSLAENKLAFIMSNEAEVNKRIYDFPAIALNLNDKKQPELKAKYYDFLSSGKDEECTKALARFYPIMKKNMGQAYRFITNTPYISEERKEFYRFMLEQRSEKIITASYEKLVKEGKINPQEYRKQHNDRHITSSVEYNGN